MGDTAGMFQFSDGAGAEKIITVGSSGSDGVPGWPFTLDDGEQFGVYGFTPANFYENNTLVYVKVDSECSFGDIFAAEYEDTAVFEIPESCSEAELLENLMKTNYTQFLAVATDNKYHLFDLANEDMSMIDGGQISLAEGINIIEKLKNGEDVIVHPADTLDGVAVTIDFQNNPNAVSLNSSKGPTLDLYLKPNILAQGSYYFANFSVFASGTSIAAANVASAIALRAASTENWSENLVERVTTSGSLVNFYNITEATDYISNPALQGGVHYIFNKQ
ncbi:unnamed protein product [Ambrosiozyma monospora]|uniref:Unnamed protein product n=1 Tax=Ambrosiozyma monospora TaxID=43982 RepID=A0ACB5U5Q8_AMBMO|nr:unnamed protein product [Ambrosiozyma monospora]